MRKIALILLAGGLVGGRRQLLLLPTNVVFKLESIQ